MFAEFWFWNSCHQKKCFFNYFCFHLLFIKYTSQLYFIIPLMTITNVFYSYEIMWFLFRGLFNTECFWLKSLDTLWSEEFQYDKSLSTQNESWTSKMDNEQLIHDLANVRQFATDWNRKYTDIFFLLYIHRVIKWQQNGGKILTLKKVFAWLDV